MVVNCEQVWREISNYVDGEVESTLRSAMDEHFHTCAKCRAVLEGMRNVVGLYGDERMLDVPAGFGRRLEKRLAQNVGEGSRWSTWSAWLVPVAALVLIVGGLEVANSLTSHPSLKSEHAQSGHDIPPDMVVLVSSDAKVFHVAGCAFIHNKSTMRTLTAKEAIQEGYVPCLRCLRKYLDVAVSNRPAVEAETAEGGEVEEEELSAAGR
jgi:hypothetical protein